MQITLGKVYRSWRRVSRAGSPEAYARTVLVHTYASHRRRRSSGERPSSTMPDAAAVASGMDAALRLTLLDELAQLSPKDRAVLVLRYWEDLSVEQTAELLHMSSGAVRNRSQRALRRLRAALGDEIHPLAPS